MGIFGSKPVRSTHFKNDANPDGVFVKPPRLSIGQWTREKLADAARATGRKLIVDPVTGKINNTRAVQRVAAYRANMRANGKACPQCGKVMRKAGYFCQACAFGVAATYANVKPGDANSLYDSSGRNRNGIRYREEDNQHGPKGSRIFPHDGDW